MPIKAVAHSPTLDPIHPDGMRLPSAATGSGGFTPYQSAVLADSPSTYYPMDDTGETTVRDLSGNNRPATYSLSGSAPSGSYSLVNSGNSGSLSARFGIDSGLHNNSSYALTNGNSAITSVPMSVEFWYYPEFTTEQNYMFMMGPGPFPGGSGGVEFRHSDATGGPGNTMGFLINNVDSSSWPNIFTTANVWYHLAFVFSTTTGDARLYVNGVDQGGHVGIHPAQDTWNAGPWLIGSNYGQPHGSPETVRISDAAIYPVALSADRILAHYNAAFLTGGPYTAAQSAGGGTNLCLPCMIQNVLHGNATPTPVDTGTGNFWHAFTDLSLPGRSYPLGFTRTYNSQSAATNSPVGYGWQINHAMALSQSGSTVTITQENGSQATFTQSGSTWAPSAPRFVASLVHNGDGTWTFVRSNRDTYTFNSAGQLTSAKDLNGYVTTLSYTAGNLTTITDPAGRTLSLGWTGSTITSVSDGNVTPSRTVQFQYNDGAGNLTDVIDVTGGHWQFGYDTSRRMTVMKDPKCFATSGCPGVQNSYDASGRVQWQKDQLNRQTTFSYATGQTTVTDPKGNQQVDTYDAGLRVAMTRGYGTAQAATWKYAYDTSTLALVGVADPNGNGTSYTVDSSGNPLTVTDALGRQTTNTYNALNEVLTSRDPNGVTTTNTYDSKGNLNTVSRPLTGTSQVQTTTYTHTDTSHPGDVTSMVDPDSKTWTYGYDANGYRNGMTDPLGNQATSVFNNDGWMTSSVSPKGNVAGCGCASQYRTSYGYNAFGQPTTVTDPLGHQTIRHYDADQNLDTFTDADSNLTTYVYDLANQQTQIKRADSPQTTLTTDYNADGTVQDQKDGKNTAILTYGYDPQARVTSLTDALSNVTAYAYDGAGNRLTQQDPGGNCAATPKTGCTSFSYDVVNQLKTITYSDGVTPNLINLAYDNDGQRTGMTDGTGTSAWVWDSLHRLTSYTNGNGAQVQYTYNLRNLPTTITYPGNNAVARGYDDAGRLTSVQDWLTNTTTFGYDPNSNLTTETLPLASGVVDTFTFDAADRMMAIADVRSGLVGVFSATYTRDNAHQLISDSSVPISASAYKYTALNQVCYAGSSGASACNSPPSGATAYAYDAADNLTQMGGIQQAFNAANQLCWTAATAGTCGSPPSGATTYAYDTRGNRTRVTPPSGGATTLSYDQANRLSAYGTAATYAYNGDGLRMSKSVSGTTSQFLWDVAGGLPLLIQDSSTAYIYGPGGLPLEQVNAVTALWLHHDQLGSTRVVTNAVGVSQATYTYDAYGNLTASTGSITNPVRFAGQYQDGDSGLFYLRARYYDARSGQFIGRDAAVSASLQPYGYVKGDPLNASDPTGMMCWAFWDANQCDNVATETVTGKTKFGIGGTVSAEAGIPVAEGTTGIGNLSAGGSASVDTWGGGSDYDRHRGNRTKTVGGVAGYGSDRGWIVGAECSLTTHVSFTNARNMSAIYGKFHNVNVDLIVISATYSWSDSGTVVFSPGIGPGPGAGVSAYDTDTTPRSWGG